MRLEGTSYFILSVLSASCPSKELGGNLRVSHTVGSLHFVFIPLFLLTSGVLPQNRAQTGLDVLCLKNKIWFQKPVANSLHSVLRKLTSRKGHWAQSWLTSLPLSSSCPESCVLVRWREKRWCVPEAASRMDDTKNVRWRKRTEDVPHPQPHPTCVHRELP